MIRCDKRECDLNRYGFCSATQEMLIAKGCFKKWIKS